jgi:myo-inositol-1(or 4)-monophosphatase
MKRNSKKRETKSDPQMSSTTDIEILECCVAAAREAGKIIREACGQISVQNTKATVQDLVTEADKRCQDLIEARIKERFPHADFLGEESVPAGAIASAKALESFLTPPRELLFIVDPIDGTTNFVSGIPISVVSIGVARRNELCVAVIYEPYRDEMFTSIKGQGAYLNGQTKLKVSSETLLINSVLGFGLGSSSRVASTMIKGLSTLEPVTRGQRALGSAALHLAYVAAGRLTVYYECDLSSWDISAGSLLVQESGGRVTDTRGASYTLSTRDILASNGQGTIHNQIVDLLVQAGADAAPVPLS